MYGVGRQGKQTHPCHSPPKGVAASSLHMHPTHALHSLYDSACVLISVGAITGRLRLFGCTMTKVSLPSLPPLSAYMSCFIQANTTGE